MILRFLILTVLVQTFICTFLIAQSKQGNVWVTGRGTQIRFVNNTIETRLTWPQSPSLSYFTSGNSNICDTNGNMILCSDGFNIYDSTGNFLDGGDTLIPLDFFLDQDGWSAISETSIFLPMDSNKYYFITPTSSDTRFTDCQTNNHCFFDLLLYNEIDMSANGGAGKVIKRMQPLLENAEIRNTQMMACRHANGMDWWLLNHIGDSNKIYKFLFTQDSVYDYGFQNFDYPVWGPSAFRGQSTFSFKGDKYASTSHGNSSGKIFLADFDRCYGIISNPKEIIMPVGSQQNPDTNWTEHLSVGLAYSPNGEILYVISMSNIYQYNLQSENWYHVSGIDTSYLYFTKYANCYLGPDGKIYIGNYHGTSKQMSVIDNPDVWGAGCNFCPRCLRLDTLGIFGAAGTPPCMPNYSLGADSCWPLTISQLANEPMSKLEVYPNPASTIIYVKSDNTEKRALYNSLGQLLFTTKEDKIDVRKYPKGFYYLKVGSAVKKIVIE